MAEPAPAPSVRPGGGESHLGLFTLNLLVLLGLGLLVSGWFLYYTGIFPVIGGLLGLGGLFAWIAFVSNLISKARKEQMQEVFERRVLLWRWTPLVVVVAAAVLVAILGFFGSVEISAVRDGVSRTVRIFPATVPPRAGSAPASNALGAPPRDVFLPARGSQRLTLPTPWFGSRRYRIEVSGLPSLPLEVRAWRRRSVAVPESFLSQPVLLVWPSGQLGNSLLQQHSGRARLEIRASRGDDEQLVGVADVPTYQGNAVWIGFGGDFEVPDWVLERWRREVAQGQAREEVAALWRRSLFADGFDLVAGDRVELTIHTAPSHGAGATAGEPLVAQTFTVRPVQRLSDIPQTEVLDGM